MVEARVRPRTRVMAVVALFAAAAFVNIILCMATETACWRVLMRLVCMAGQALDLCVFAD